MKLSTTTVNEGLRLLEVFGFRPRDAVGTFVEDFDQEPEPGGAVYKTVPDAVLSDAVELK